METAQAVSNTQIVQQCYGYFGQGNIPALLGNLTDDIQWFTPGPPGILPMAGLRTGKQGVAEFFRLVNESTEFLVFEPREFIADGDKVVCLGYWEGKSKKTGKVGKSDWAMVFTFRNGKVVKFNEFSDTWAGAEAYK